MVRVPGFAEVLEVDESVLLQALVQRAEIGGAKAEWIGAEEMVKVPVDELPVEAVVVGDEEAAAFAVGLKPVAKSLHHGIWIVESEALLAREAADGERFG